MLKCVEQKHEKCNYNLKYDGVCDEDIIKSKKKRQAKRLPFEWMKISIYLSCFYDVVAAQGQLVFGVDDCVTKSVSRCADAAESVFARIR